ncbi:MAG: glycosyltransferase family 4 protein [Dysgonamonadaceae bacterium]|nr:glycosyltransferase family 4 protein [Dysgonamonadaceae bacterium]
MIWRKMKVKENLLVLGVLPPELGGSYFNGVTTVIRDLTPHFLDSFNVAIFATNVNELKIKNRSIMMKNGCSVNIFGYSYYKLFTSLLFELIKKPGKIIKEMNLYNRVYGMPPLRMLLYRLSLERVITEHNPKIIHSHGVVFLPILKNINHEAKIVTTYHGIPYNDKSAVEFNLKQKIDIRKLYVETTNIIENFTCLNSVKFKEIEELLNTKQKYKIIGNGIDLYKFFFNLDERKSIREEYEVKENEKVLITVASLRKWKGHSLFLEYIACNNLDVKYWIAGDGPEYEALRKQAKELDIEENVKFLGIIQNHELYKYYSASDSFILPSSSEGQAMVILEALACGLPVYVNEKIYETLEFGSDVMKIITPINFETNQKEISLETKSEISRDQIIDYMKHYSWENIANEYVKFFEETINQ